MSGQNGDDNFDQSPLPDYSNSVAPITSPINPKHPARRLTPQQVDQVLGQLTVTWESLPQLPFWAPLTSRNVTWQRNSVAANINALAVTLQRPLASNEVNAIAQIACKARVKETYEIPLVVAAAAFFTYRGRKTWRFPLWTPKPTSTWFSPNFFPTIRAHILQGPQAMALWTGTRFVAYVAAIRCISQPMFNSWANVGYGLDILRDMRLKSLVQEMQEMTKKERPGSQNTQQQQPQQLKSTPWSEQPRPSWRTPQQPAEEKSAFDDDSGIFDDDDDASPVSRSHRRSDPAISTTPTASGSSWSRLRDQAKTGTAASKSSGGYSPSSETDSYTYSDSDRESNYAKAQVQKEFDALLERERRSSS
ncbi:hypothetical protein QBC38DRAFT_462908 [Podospora fimiseda]|uniref:Uncharacterized protein n=1 Tax=Podospora fimiseda TaxID=252190 RepID=A0AAN7BZF5_9PEZI|nr:hypothetical protein QBC38DRAFT_462908 [Podospora fimiseda]